MKVWVILGESESGDKYGPLVFSKRPSSAKKKSIAKKWDGGDGSGPGDYGTYIYLSISTVVVDAEVP